MRLAQVLTSITVLLTVVFAFQAANARVFATATLVLLASSSGGALVGFLFALPRETSLPPADPSRLRYLSNSNLLKVSDWVTTIIVGLTLVNVRSVGSAIGDLGSALDKPLGGSAQSAAFGIALVIFGATGTAILTYLWTAVRLRELLEQSIIELERQSALDKAGESGEDIKSYLKTGGTAEDARSAVEALPVELLGRVREEIVQGPATYDADAQRMVIGEIDSRIESETSE